MKSMVFLCLNVLKDWRVITVTILMIIFISLGNYVVKYKKKPPKIKKSKIVAPPPPPAEGEAKEEGSE